VECNSETEAASASPSMPAVSSFSFPFFVGNVERLFTGDFEAEASFPLWRFYFISSTSSGTIRMLLTPPLNLFRFSSSPLAGSPPSFPFPLFPCGPAEIEGVLFPANLVLVRVFPGSIVIAEEVLALRFVPLPSTGLSSKAGSIWWLWSDIIESRGGCKNRDKGDPWGDVNGFERMRN